MLRTPSIVVGYHGCDQAVADRVIKKDEHIQESKNSYDWLGHGIYFWEGSYSRALDWAKSKNYEKPAVIGAFIKLGNCLDLLDPENLAQVKYTHDVLKKEIKNLGKSFPENSVIQDDISFSRELDCQVIMRLHTMNNDLINEKLKLSRVTKSTRQDPDFIDSVRGMFPEGKPLYDNAGFRDKNHIQLCIVNPNCIAGYFRPMQENENFKSLLKT